MNVGLFLDRFVVRRKTDIRIMASFDQISLTVYSECFYGNYNLTFYYDTVYQGVLVFVITLFLLEL